MTLHRRNRLPLALAAFAALVIVWLWQMTLPLLEEQSLNLQNRRAELRQRQQAAALQIYQPLIDKLQHPLPEPAVIVALLRKNSGLLDLADTTYTLSQVLPLDHTDPALKMRHLSISLPKADAATALALWQDLRQALPCELRLTSFNGEGSSARLDLELLGSAS